MDRGGCGRGGTNGQVGGRTLYYGDLDDGCVLHNMFAEAGGKISGCYRNFQPAKKGARPGRATA